jgi:NAD-dependent dihydropyrimidine dehydrogenase PreA subunit
MVSSKAIRLGVVIQIDADQCIGCAICADVCPTGALLMGREDLLPSWRAENCSACADCFRECPTAAVRVARKRMAGTATIDS